MNHLMVMVLASVCIIPENLASYSDSKTLAPVSITSPTMLSTSKYLTDYGDLERSSVTSPLAVFRGVRLPEFDRQYPYPEVNRKERNRLKKALTKSDILQLINSGAIRYIRNTSTKKKKKLEVLDSSEDEKPRSEEAYTKNNSGFESGPVIESEESEESEEREESESVYENESGSVYENESGSVYENESGSVYENESESVHENESESVYENESGSVYENESGSVYENESGSVYENESESVHENESDDAESGESYSVTESESTEDLESTETEEYTQNREGMSQAASRKTINLIRHSGSTEYEDSAVRSESRNNDESEEEFESTEHAFTLSSESTSYDDVLGHKITKIPSAPREKTSTALTHANGNTDSAEISEEESISETVQESVMRKTKTSVNKKSTVKSESYIASGENSYESVDVSDSDEEDYESVDVSDSDDEDYELVDVSDSDEEGYESVSSSTRLRTPLSTESEEWPEGAFRSSQSSEISTSSSAKKIPKVAVAQAAKHTEVDDSQESSEEYTSSESKGHRKTSKGGTVEGLVEESSLNDDAIIAKKPLSRNVNSVKSIIFHQNATNPVVIHKSRNSVYMKNEDIRLSKNPKHLILDISTADQKDVEKMLSAESRDILTADTYDLSAITIILDSPKEKGSPKESKNPNSPKIVVPEHSGSDEKDSDSLHGTKTHVKSRKNKKHSSFTEDEESYLSEISEQSQNKTKRFKGHHKKSRHDSSEEHEVDESKPKKKVTEPKSLDQDEEPEKYRDYYPVSVEDRLRYGIECYILTAEEFAGLYSEKLKNKILSLSHSIIHPLEISKNSTLKIPYQSELIKRNYTVFKYRENFIEICTLPREKDMTESPDSERKNPKEEDSDDISPTLPEPGGVPEMKRKKDHKKDGTVPSKDFSATGGQISSSQIYSDKGYAKHRPPHLTQSYYSSAIDGNLKRVRGSIYRWNGTHLHKVPYPVLRAKSCICRGYETRKQMPIKQQMHSYQENASGIMADMTAPKTIDRFFNYRQQGANTGYGGRRDI